jgi:hypothetical protein
MAGYEWNLGGLEHDLEQLKSLLNICRLQCSRLWELEEGRLHEDGQFFLGLFDLGDAVAEEFERHINELKEIVNDGRRNARLAAKDEKKEAVAA